MGWGLSSHYQSKTNLMLRKLMFCSKFPLFIRSLTFKSAIRLSVVMTLSLILSACQSYKLDDNWPSDIPPRKIFIDGYLEKRDLTQATDAELSYHLGWIKKFYQGTTLYPNGWLSASEQFIATIDSRSEKKSVAKRMQKLGIAIGNEWAQDNSIRLINNTNMVTWASAMRTAAERNTHSVFLDKVEKDVQALLSEEISSRDIKYDRYFEEESFDDF